MSSDGGYRLPDVVDDGERIYVCVPVPDQQEHRHAFAGAIYSLARWWNWERDDDKRGAEVASVWFDIWLNVIDQLDLKPSSCGVDTVPGTECPVLPIGGPGDALGDELDDCEDEMTLKIVHIDGVPYLQDDGYTGTTFYQITPVSVSSDGEGVCILPPGDDEVVREYPPVGDDYLSCYAGKVVPYLLNRAYLFYEFAEQLSLQGIDAILGNWDELADTVAMILDLLGGDGQSNILEMLRGTTLAEIQTAMADPDYIAFMESQWTVQSAPSRTEIAKWASKSPHTWDGVAVGAVLALWVNYSFWPHFQNEIAVFAYECTTGNTIDDITPDYEDVEQGGVNYRVWEWTPNVVLDTEGEQWFPPDIGMDMVAMAVEFDCEGVETDNCVVRLYVDGRTHAASSVYQGNTYYRLVATADDAVNAEVIVENMRPDDYIYVGANLSAAVPEVKLSENGGGNQVRIQRVIALGIVPA